MSGGDFDDDWEPVSAAEMKVIQAKQERSNKISKIMGDYLLKGEISPGNFGIELTGAAQ